MITRGWALAQQGQIEEGIAQIRQGTTDHWATVEQSWHGRISLLAEAQKEGGQIEEALALLDEALGASHKRRMDAHEPELYRLKGELTLKQSRVPRLASSTPNTLLPTPK